MATTVARALAKYSAHLSVQSVIVDDVDVRLVLIDPSQNIDKYYVLQALEDKEVEGDDRFFSFQHWGRTGSAGDGKLEGPSKLSDVKVRLAVVFKDKTGAEWGTIQPGDRAPPGKYWLQQVATPDVKAQWEYYVGDGVDGKRPGWYPYAADASDGVESLHAQHEANARESRTSSRIVDSGHFSYNVALEAMTQRNTRTGKVREIRRVLGVAEGSQPATAQDIRMATKAGMSPMKAMKKRSPLLMKTRSKKIEMKSMRSARAKKSMKAVMKKAMKKKPMKKMKKSSIVAKGKRAKAKVWRGTKVKTSKGLKKVDLMRNKNGKVVSKKKSALGRKQFGPNLARWVGACKQARKELGITGFLAIKKGTPLYEKAKELHPTTQPHVLLRSSSSRSVVS